ncbi:hypothetical protein [Thiolapillus sp.]
MIHELEHDEISKQTLLWKKCPVITLIAAIAMTMPVVAEEEPDMLVFQERDIENMVEDQEAGRLMDMANRAGITLTRETIRRMLAVHPDILDAELPGERDADLQEAVAIYPARFEVTGQAKIYEDSSFTTKNAGGRFASASIDVLLNFSSVLGGVSYENMALWGTSHNKEIEAKLAVDAESEAYGVYGRADAGPPPFPAVSYGVYGTTNQASGYGGYFVNTASSTSAYSQALYVKADGKYDHNSSDPRAYVATVEATNSANASMLAVYLSRDEANSADTYIGFIARNRANDANRLAGQIRGVTSGSENGVTLVSNAADFAEFLERANPQETMQPGDIVGVVKGRISKDLTGAHNIQVISTSPIVGGNMPAPDKEHLYEQVAFLGQVPVKVAGKVTAGDYIVASGNSDGLGYAVAPKDMTPEHFRLSVGQAWESSDEKGVKLVKAVVGLAANDAYAYMKKQDQRIARLERQLSGKMAQLDRLASRLEMLTRKVAYIQASSTVAKVSAQ